MPRFTRNRHDAALITSYLRQLRHASEPKVPDVKRPDHVASGTIRKAPAGHSRTQIPQPLQ